MRSVEIAVARPRRHFRHWINRRSWLTPALLMLLWTAPLSAAVCTFNGPTGNWDDTGSWTGCSGGAGGNGIDTPGFGDTAVINSGAVTVQFLEQVSTLQLNGGAVFLDGAQFGVLEVDTAFDWSGGTVDGFAGNLNLLSTSVSTWNGADLTAINATAINIEGTVNWTGGLIHLGDSVIGVVAGGIFNIDTDLAPETINVQAPFTFGQLFNDGQINKTGTQSVFLDQGVTLDGPGDLDVSTGLLIISSGNIDGNVNIDSGATLRIEGGGLFDTANFTGVGDLHLGPTTPVPGCNVTINSSFAFPGLVRVNNCAANFGGSSATFSNLILDHPMAIIGGPAAIDVTSLLTWSEGAIIGAPAETFTLGAGATGSMGGPAGPPVRSLSGRTFINDGAIIAFNGNGLEMFSGATFQIGASGTLEFAMAAAASFAVTDDASGNQWLNAGGITLTTGAFVSIQSPLDNNGTITVNNGIVDLAGDGTGTGNYVANAPGQLSVSAANRTVPGGSSISGSGALAVQDGAILTVDGGLTVPDLAVNGPSPAQLLYTNAPNLSLDQLLIADGSSLQTAGPIQIATLAILDDGRLTATAPVSLFVFPGANLVLPSVPGTLFTFDDIAAIVAGSALWQGGGIHLDNGAQFQIQASGSLTIDSNTMSPQILGCSSCASPFMLNQGLLLKQAMGSGDDAQINAPIDFFNQGTLQINGGDLLVEQFAQNNAAGSTLISPGASLSFGAGTGSFTAGTLSGDGTVNGDVSVNGGTLAPGMGAPGVLTVNGNFNLPAGLLDMELDGTLPGQFDQVQVTGTSILGGTVDVSQSMAFVPQPTDQFPLVVTTGGLLSTATLGINDFPGFDIEVVGNDLVFRQPAGPAGFVVTTTLDPGDGTCDIAGTGDGCTLREAINAANGNAGPDFIDFNIVGAGVQTIAPLTPLPTITEALFIDGLTQPGAAGNTIPADVGGLNGTLLIELSGQNTTGDGLVIDAGSDEVYILGLVINRWSGAGVRVNSTFAIDGTTRSSPANAFSTRRNAQRGVFAVANVLGSYIGTSADGLSVPGPQGNGVVVGGNGVSGTIFIGDGLADGRNLISGHVDHGVVIGADQVELYGNLIGTDVTGLAALGNGRRGIHFSADNANNGVVGGDTPDMTRNIISGNSEDGIGFQCAPAGPDQCFDMTRIVGNYIGVGVDGLTPIPNANGINFIQMTYGRVEIGSTAVNEFNKIEFNLGAGVLAAPFAVAGLESEEGRVSINGNVFAANGGPAIDLGADGRTPNDAMDPDAGFNNGQNFPEITDFLPDTPGTGLTTVEYAVRTDPANALYPLQVEFYRANGDEGFELLGTDFYLLAEAGMLKQFQLPGAPTFAPEDVIIATATDANGKTSEFTFYPVTVEITDDSPDPSQLGDPYTVEVTVSKVAGPYTPVGDVFVDDGESLPQNCGFSLLVGDGGTGSCVLASPANTGTLNLFAAFDGINTPFGGSVPDFDPDGELHDVNNPTSLLLTDAVDPTPVGEAFTLGVTVNAAVGGPATGTVNVTSTGGESCSAPLAGGIGSCQLTPLTQGPRTLSAFYIPDPGFDPSSANELHGVVMASSTVAIVSDLPDPSMPGQSVSVVIDVDPANAGNVLAPTGAVSISANTGESCMIAAVDGAGGGNCSLVFNTVGMRIITATYAGDANFTAAVSVGEPHDVTNAAPEDTTTTILSTTPSPSLVGQPYVVQVQVSGNLGNTPCGDVQLTQLPDGSICSATLTPTATPGVASGSCTLTAPSAITKAILGSYQPGACNFNGSQAPLFTHAVNRASTTTTITGQSPNPSAVGQPVTVSFTVAVQAPGAGAPTGSVTVTDGIDVCQATLPATSCQLAFKTQGNRTLNVSYGGDANFNGSGSNATQTVGPVGSGADLSIRKRNDRCVLPGGQRSSYRIEVSNAGPAAVSGARVQDTVPASLTGASWTCSGSGGGTCAASGSGSIDQLVNLPAGASVVFMLAADAPIAPETLVTNTATVQPPSGISDPQLSNNSSTDSDPIGVFCDGAEDPFSD